IKIYCLLLLSAWKMEATNVAPTFALVLMCLIEWRQHGSNKMLPPFIHYMLIAWEMEATVEATWRQHFVASTFALLLMYIIKWRQHWRQQNVASNLKYM